MKWQRSTRMKTWRVKERTWDKDGSEVYKVILRMILECFSWWCLASTSSSTHLFFFWNIPFCSGSKVRNFIHSIVWVSSCSHHINSLPLQQLQSWFVIILSHFKQYFVIGHFIRHALIMTLFIEGFFFSPSFIYILKQRFF